MCACAFITVLAQCLQIYGYLSFQMTEGCGWVRCWQGVVRYLWGWHGCDEGAVVSNSAAVLDFVLFFLI